MGAWIEIDEIKGGKNMNNEEKILQKLDALQAEILAVKDTLQAEISTVKDDILSIKMTQENIIIPQIQLLAEGHTAIQNQIKNLSVIDALQDDVATLKNAVRYLSAEIDKLKSAM